MRRKEMFKSKPSNSILQITAKRRNPKERACKAKKVKKVPVLKHRLTKKKNHMAFITIPRRLPVPQMVSHHLMCLFIR